MKKIFFVFLTLAINCLSIYASESYIEHLKNCSPYSLSESIEQLNAKVSKKILGFKNGYCRYQEHIEIQETSTIVSCKFNKKQLHELTMELDNYIYNVEDYKNQDINNLQNKLNDHFLKTWDKYLLDENICKTSRQ